MPRQKREDTIIACFKVDKYTCEYDGRCWMVNSDDGTKQFYYGNLEGMCHALLNKITSERLKNDFRNIIQILNEAKHEISDAVKFITINVPDEEEED